MKIEHIRDRKNNCRVDAYQLVKDLTTEKLGKSTFIQDKSGKCLTEENKILTDGQSTAQTFTTMRLMGTQ